MTEEVGRKGAASLTPGPGPTRIDFKMFYVKLLVRAPMFVQGFLHGLATQGVVLPLLSVIQSNSRFVFFACITSQRLISLHRHALSVIF